MVRRSILFILFFAILVSLTLVSLTLVSAAVTLNVPTEGGNYTAITFNCTQLITDIANATNASIYYNASGGFAGSAVATGAYLGNLTNDTSNDLYFNGTISIESLNDSIAYNFTCMVDNGTAQSWSVGIPNVTIDNTPPNVSTFYNTLVNGNYSGSIVLNVSVNQTITGIDSVYFNITNSSGQVNWTQASGSGIYYNATFNTASLADGMYNITVYANESQLGNLNSSEWIQITIDNTPPSLTYSCTPSSVDEGDTVTCSCSGTDATSGFNSSSLSSYTSSPSTSSTGTFTLTDCSGRDYAGNLGTGTATYTVVGIASSRRSSTTAATWTKTYTVTDEQFAEGSTKHLSKKHRMKVQVSGEDHYVGLTDLTSTTATISVSSTLQTATISIGEEKKFDVIDDGYYDLIVKLNSIANNKANLTIKSIHEEMPEEEPEEEAAPVTEEAPLGEIPEEAPGSLLWLWILIIIVVVAVIIYVLYKKKKTS